MQFSQNENFETPGKIFAATALCIFMKFSVMIPLNKYYDLNDLKFSIRPQFCCSGRMKYLRDFRIFFIKRLSVNADSATSFFKKINHSNHSR